MAYSEIIDFGIKVKNYKCFGEEEQGFDKIYPINIVIGKNNSGKSTLLDVIESKVASNIASKVKDANGEIIINSKRVDLKDKVCEKVYAELKGTYNINAVEMKITECGVYEDEDISLEVYKRNLFCNTGQEQLGNPNPVKVSIRNAYINLLSGLFSTKQFKRINAERDILPLNGQSDQITLNEAGGESATNMVREIVNSSKYNPDIVHTFLLNAIKKIVEPDISFQSIYTRQTGSSWEIYFKNGDNRIIQISKMGSGIKTVILVLLNLIVLPEVENKPKKDYVFAFEELENNLHPSLLRRLLNFINDYAKENACHFFITTHSSTTIDFFNKNPNAQICYVENINNNTLVKTLMKNKNKNVIQDLGYQASDILLSNGIIWVEGPSDAIYLELLIEIYCKENNIEIDKLNYSIQVLSTALWKYAGFKEFDWSKLNSDLRNQIINLAKINHNHLVILDNDGNYDDKKPSQWESFSDGTGINKAKLIYESILSANENEDSLEDNFGNAKNERLLFWVNKGTFETYLEYFISAKGKDEFKKYFSKNSTHNYLEKKRTGIISKVELASLIVSFARKNELTFSDFGNTTSELNEKVRRLINSIKKWNYIS